MTERKNNARLVHKGHEFTIYQDRRDYWYFSYQHLLDVNTQHRELQPALNEAYASIEDLQPRSKSESTTRRKTGKRRRNKFPPQRKLDVAKN